MDRRFIISGLLLLALFSGCIQTVERQERREILLKEFEICRKCYIYKICDYVYDDISLLKIYSPPVYKCWETIICYPDIYKNWTKRHWGEWITILTTTIPTTTTLPSSPDLCCYELCKSKFNNLIKYWFRKDSETGEHWCSCYISPKSNEPNAHSFVSTNVCDLLAPTGGDGGDGESSLHPSFPCLPHEVQVPITCECAKDTTTPCLTRCFQCVNKTKTKYRAPEYFVLDYMPNWSNQTYTGNYTTFMYIDTLSVFISELDKCDVSCGSRGCFVGCRIYGDNTQLKLYGIKIGDEIGCETTTTIPQFHFNYSEGTLAVTCNESDCHEVEWRSTSHKGFRLTLNRSYLETTTISTTTTLKSPLTSCLNNCMAECKEKDKERVYYGLEEFPPPYLKYCLGHCKEVTKYSEELLTTTTILDEWKIVKELYGYDKSECVTMENGTVYKCCRSISGGVSCCFFSIEDLFLKPTTDFPKICRFECGNNITFEMRVDINPKHDELYIPFLPYADGCNISCSKEEETTTTTIPKEYITCTCEACRLCSDGKCEVFLTINSSGLCIDSDIGEDFWAGGEVEGGEPEVDYCDYPLICYLKE